MGELNCYPLVTEHHDAEVKNSALESFNGNIV